MRSGVHPVKQIGRQLDLWFRTRWCPLGSPSVFDLDLYKTVLTDAFDFGLRAWRMAREKDVNWNLPDLASWDRTHAAILMDLRDELKKLNALLHCSNFVRIPSMLERTMCQTDRIARNTAKRRRKVVK